MKIEFELTVVVNLADGSVVVLKSELLFSSGLKLSSGVPRVAFQLANNELSLLSGSPDDWLAADGTGWYCGGERFGGCSVQSRSANSPDLSENGDSSDD